MPSWPELADLPLVAAPAAGRPAHSRSLLAEHFPGGQAAWVLLSLGQLAALVAAVLELVGICSGLSALTEQRRLGVPASEWASVSLIATGLLHALLWLAVCVVFGRAKVLADLAEQQDAENRRLSEELAELRGGAGAATADAAGPTKNSSDPRAV